MSKLGLLGDLIGRLIKAGYPESTAVKIATGELPMDQASRMARAQDQGFTEKMYHTGAYSDNPKGILEINPSVDSWGAGSGGETGTFFASHPEVSASYTDSDVASRPTSYPMLINTRGMEKINADGENWNTIYNPAVVDPDGQQVMEVLSGMDGEYLQPIFKDEYASTNDLAIGARRRMATGSVIDNVVDVGPNGIAFNASIKANNPHEYPHEWVQDYERKGGKIISLQDGSQARSELAAAFDPDQIHSTNILASNPAAGVGAGVLSAVVGQQPQGLMNAMAGRDALLSPEELSYLKSKQKFNSNFSDDTGYERGDILPFRTNQNTGDTEFATPQMLKGLLGAFYDYGQIPKSGIFNPKSLEELI